MLDYPALRAVAMVVETGSFEKAAAALRITPSAVSQRVKQLEERLGTVLIVRGNPCVATSKGAWLCRHMEHVGLLEQELLAQLPTLSGGDAPLSRVTLHLATNADSLGTWFLAAVNRFASASGCLLKIEVDDQDHTAEWLQGGHVLAAVTGDGRPVRGCRMTPLGSLRYMATASPEFIARHFDDGVTPEALAHAPSLTFNQKDGLQQRWVQQVFGRTISPPTHWLPSTQGFVEASLGGLGWGMNPIQLVRDHLKSGALVELVAETPLDVPLFWQVNRLAADPLADLTREIVAAARRALEL
ncbi:LysR family transcriptional regulator ArgP [Rhizobium sp. SAFR-030]|uniref:LysR family transcriptional regulator ArgP n=1 Tax=Rhizobium sp. SAFR-030 TaxID=3387277 RepID=UPI003F807F5E